MAFATKAPVTEPPPETFAFGRGLIARGIVRSVEEVASCRVSRGKRRA